MLNCVSFDWFSFTLKNMNVESVFMYLGLKQEEFTQSSYGRFGYSSMLLHDVFDISVLFDGTPEMGVHVSVSGKSIRYFMECFINANGVMTPFGKSHSADYRDEFAMFASYVLKHGSFSRVDVNIDTQNRFLNPFNIRDAAEQGNIISLYRSWKFYQGSDGSATIYFGKRTSNSCIRIYDKAKEQGDFDSVLYRFEVQFNKMSDVFMMNFIENGLSEAFYAFVHKQIRFSAGGNYFAKSLAEWDKFMHSILKAPKASFNTYKAVRRKNTINSLLHMFYQYSGVLSDFFENFGEPGDFMDFMFNILNYFDTGSRDESDVLNFCHEKGWMQYEI